MTILGEVSPPLERQKHLTSVGGGVSTWQQNSGGWSEVPAQQQESVGVDANLPTERQWLHHARVWSKASPLPDKKQVNQSSKMMPLYDLNLTCPICGNHYHTGGIQKFREHVNKCGVE